MDKAEALDIVFNCVQLYKNNLVNKKFLFISFDKQNYNYIEVLFQKSNYLHLTGLELKNKISASSFYDRCIRKRLSINDFEFKENGTAELKLSVLSQLMNINKVAKMIGNYNNSKPKLYTEKLTGNVHACMGLVKDGECYYPNTGLRQDTRDLIKDQGRIIAIFYKTFSEKIYSNSTYIAKGIDLKSVKLPKDILSKLNSNIFDDQVAIDSTIELKDIETKDNSEIKIAE